MARVLFNGIKKVYPAEKGKEKKEGPMYENGGFVAVQKFSMEIKDKEFIVLVGPSGCGKSTTLRMVAGLEEISDGELYIGDTLVNDVEPKDRNIAMVFQNYALYPHMTVYENMAYALKLKKVPKDEIDKKVREAAEILDITELLARKPRALSGGQRQRVAIGRAIVRSPQVFLMDEPLSNLDAKLRNQMRSEIIKLRQKIDTTFIYVTHDQVEAMTLGDRMVVMKDGFIQQIGTPSEVFNNPANVFVAGFIGTPQMNFFDGILSGSDVILGEKKIALTGAKKASAEKLDGGEKNVIVGIRPENLSLTEADDPEAIEAVVDVTEMMGSTVHLHLNVLGKDCIVVLQGSGIGMADTIKDGSRIYLKPDIESIHIFEKETEKNILI